MAIKIDLENPRITSLQMHEYQTTLQDSWLDIVGLSEPKHLRYMNIDQIPVHQPRVSDLGYFAIQIFLSNRVVIQKRVVYNILMMFSDVGGLYDFIFLGLHTIITFCSSDLAQAELIQKLFLVVDKTDMLKRIDYPVLSALTRGLLPIKNGRIRRKAYLKGSKKF